MQPVSCDLLLRESTKVLYTISSLLLPAITPVAREHLLYYLPMKPINATLDFCRDRVRVVMNHIAAYLNRLSNGKLTPNTVTVIGLLAHLPIAVLIATEHTYWAALLLLVFGLFDALDGALARIQKKASSGGMLLDASTDRMKEVMLYSGVGALFIASSQASWAIWAIIACGASLCVSYVKAKGETAVRGGSFSPNEINRLFQDGFLRFELRMALLIIGLVTPWLTYIVAAIAVLASITAVERLVKIMRYLARHD